MTIQKYIMVLTFISSCRLLQIKYSTSIYIYFYLSIYLFFYISVTIYSISIDESLCINLSIYISNSHTLLCIFLYNFNYLSIDYFLSINLSISLYIFNTLSLDDRGWAGEGVPGGGRQRVHQWWNFAHVSQKARKSIKSLRICKQSMTVPIH